MELWGSPGGRISQAALPQGYRGNEPGYGGYTKLFVRIGGNEMLYCFVGSAGNGVSSGISVGGWNGGGWTTTCPYGPHSASGGGMTHISYTNNLAVADTNVNGKGSWSPTGTIGVAGGGGGAFMDGMDVPIRSDTFSGWGGGKNAGNGYSCSSGSAPHLVRGATQTSGWARGCGRSSAGSSGGGGGWYGGESYPYYCSVAGAGGSGYICPEGELTKYTPYNLCLSGNDPSIPRKPNAGTTLSQHGYIRVTLQERMN